MRLLTVATILQRFTLARIHQAGVLFWHSYSGVVGRIGGGSWTIV